jgi:hypothetical protein
VRAYFEDYPENSRSAILRAAILVAYSDSTWHELEREQLEKDADLDDEILLRELDKISTDVPEEIRGLGDDEEREAFWQTCLAPIVSRDIQQLTIAARTDVQGMGCKRQGRAGDLERVAGSS